jgi:8-amino-7-oxononanoate synthase
MTGKRSADVLSKAMKDTVMSLVKKGGSGRAALAERAWSAADFSELAAYKELQTQRGAGEIFEIEDPFFRVHEARAGATTRIGGREVINFASYDYLGLNGHPAVAAAAMEAMRKFGTSASASRVVAGERGVHRDLERRVADVYGVEDAVAYVSGHATNVSAISTLLGPRDLILCDALVHNSVTVGAQLSGAARRSFPHNDLDALERTLAELRGGHQNVLIAVEGLYSMDGDVPNLKRLVEIKSRYGAWLMVDEAHALGVLGQSGRGAAEHCGIDGRAVDIWMGTLSKTCAACGGFIAGSKALVDVLKCTSSGFVYSVGMPPPMAAAALAALEAMAREPERVARLQANSRLFFETARRAGLDTGFAQGHAVIGIMVGDSLRAVKLTERLLEAGINALPIIHPAVPMQAARLRFFLSSEHTAAQIETAVAATKRELARLEAEKFGLSKLAASVLAKKSARR